MQQTPNWQEIHNKQALENPGYVEGMNPKRGPNAMVSLLDTTLSRVGDIFEFGVGPGANAIYLAEKGHRVEALDVSDEMLKFLKHHLSERGLSIPIDIASAQDYVPRKNYDAFVSTFILHFMPEEDAKKVIETMQSYTHPGGYNALGMFMAESSWARNERYYPMPEQVLELYKGWHIIKQNVWTDANNPNKVLQTMNILLQKPV